ncbi:MAG: YlbF family regulator [Bacilli bacterium]|jgi:cell fate (sporulation/competence/biofilm development) regulator YlbF (YheA/YmcA/DUF963 family)|nr:YlbF family regulator [Bacilli bacterium]
MNNNNLLEDAKELSKAFLETETVKKYLLAKKTLEEDKRLNALKNEIVRRKKDLKNIAFEARGAEVKSIKELQASYDNDSLVVTYQELKEKVEEMEQSIRDLFII